MSVFACILVILPLHVKYKEHSWRRPFVFKVGGVKAELLVCKCFICRSACGRNYFFTFSNSYFEVLYKHFFWSPKFCKYSHTYHPPHPRPQILTYLPPTHPPSDGGPSCTFGRVGNTKSKPGFCFAYSQPNILKICNLNMPA